MKEKTILMRKPGHGKSHYSRYIQVIRWPYFGYSRCTTNTQRSYGKIHRGLMGAWVQRRCPACMLVLMSDDGRQRGFAWALAPAGASTWFLQSQQFQLQPTSADTFPVTAGVIPTGKGGLNIKCSTFSSSAAGLLKCHTSSFSNCLWGNQMLVLSPPAFKSPIMLLNLDLNNWSNTRS